MKKLVSFSLMLVLLVTTFLISGCLPPNYSKEKAKEIAQAHQKDALGWFEKNMPDAKPDKECEAYQTGIDLLGAVKGEYKRNGKTHKYVYEYTNKKMYVSEGYDDTCKIVENIVLKDFGYTKEESEVSFHGYQFVAKNENDATRRRNPDEKEPKEIYSYQEKLMPAGITPEEFAKALLDPDTKEKFDFYIHLYRDGFPEQQLDKQKKYKNLGSVWCNRKIDLINEPQGIYEKVYLKKEIKNRYYHIVKISDDLYGGYITQAQMPKGKDGVSYKYNKDRLTLIIPDGSQPIIFSKKALTLVHAFKNGKGDLIENVAEEMHRAKKGNISGYHQYSTELFIKDDFSHGYQSIRVPLVKGVYNYKILGIFDLDYWKLKFFD